MPSSIGSAGLPPRPVPRPVPSEVAPSRGFWALRDLPTIIWLILVAIVAIAHQQLPIPSWLLLHLVFLGAVTHAILVWSQHFAFALTRTPHTIAHRRWQNLRLLFANIGVALIVLGVPLAIWPLTAVGSGLLIVAVLAHGFSLYRRMRKALPGRFTKTLRYYVASAAFLPIGAVVGAWLAGTGDPAGRLLLTHAIINVFGWIGLTVAGTLVTLWPTMLRTRADDVAAVGTARALPVLAASVVVAALGAATGIVALLALGFAGYIVGLAMISVSLAREARNTPPSSFATLSAGSAVLWLFGCLVVLTVVAFSAWVSGDGVAPVRVAIDWVAPYFAAGFAAQVLIGALSYLVPVVLGGGPTPVRVGTATLDSFGPLRVATANVALLVCALPVSSLMWASASVLYLIAMGSFLPLFFVALRRQKQAKSAGPKLASPTFADRPLSGTDRVESNGSVEPVGKRAGQAVAGLLTVILVTAISGAVDPQSIAPVAPLHTQEAVGQNDSNEADAPVQTVQIEAADMRFTPDVIEVPVGTSLVIELTNTDETEVHDLVLANGVSGSRLAPGASETLDAGVMDADLEGWCSIVGHRQMGMTLDIIAVGAAEVEGSLDTPRDQIEPDAATDGSAAGLIDLSVAPGPDFTPYDAALKPLLPADGPVTHRITLPVTEQVTEVAPGVRQRLWTFGETAPGPTLHGRVGDRFVITLINDGSIGHSIDFHAGELAPDEPMRTIAPGEQLTYTFTANRSGIWMYHCSTAPMSAHIANGMFGSVIIEPPELPSVDRSYVLMQSEYYLGPQDGEVDMARLQTERPDLVVFNGYASQYEHAPLTAGVGERVRVWVLDIGPSRASSFHVVGGQFDIVWSEGRYLINREAATGAQVLPLLPAQGGFVELKFVEAGHYPFVSHVMIDSERGANGIFKVHK